jgi:DNA-directed RNA polymerase specialized sigma24 family protein
VGKLLAIEFLSLSKTLLNMEEIRPKPGRKSSWTETENSFKSLLAWLDDGKDTDGRSYLEIRRRLVAYFDRKGCSGPDQLADETLSRVTRRLEEEGWIAGEAPARYCYITARFVFLEHIRNDRLHSSIEDAPAPNRYTMDSSSAVDEAELREKMINCLDTCAAKLDPPTRELIYTYYVGKAREKIENRRSIAERIGISMNALAIKACRIRAKLEACVSKCANEG